jgi:hypothetical protein
VFATGSPGSTSGSTIAALTGVSATGSLGTFGIAVGLKGVLATGTAGSISQAFAWSVIDDTQTANWQNIGNTQTASWAAVSTN